MFTRFASVALLFVAAPALAQTVGTPALQSPAAARPSASAPAQPLANGSPSALPNAMPGTAKPSAPAPGSATANGTAPVGNAASNQVTNH